VSDQAAQGAAQGGRGLTPCALELTTSRGGSFTVTIVALKVFSKKADPRHLSEVLSNISQSVFNYGFLHSLSSGSCVKGQYKFLNASTFRHYATMIL
jgi:uncharacterized membrane protein